MLDSTTATRDHRDHRPLDVRPQAAPSRLAVRAAHVAVLSTVPSGLWRIAGAAGIPLGFGQDDLLHESNFPSRYSFYLVGLSILAELVALLTLGLVRRWGEVVPRWIPYLGGRPINRWAATIPALLGAAVLCTVGVIGTLTWNSPENMGAPDSPSGAAYWVMTLAYAPLLLWGPALTITAVAYFRRHSPHTPNQPNHG
ncbi:hypothetical protein [Embleya hyalina]|uniref:Uncharacterized protein n=1 Tax=Embleya hyalina TaxID=516124 RepID=A0A401Z598_9ACTN|nr:hypothetical protein [Embleya hyalina]GCE02014.1 hypothetical protein EHYA_09789 [Embleya hyalina]